MAKKIELKLPSGVSPLEQIFAESEEAKTFMISKFLEIDPSKTREDAIETFSGQTDKRHALAHEYFEDGNVEGVFSCFDNTESLVILADNIPEFKAKGLYEEALICAFTRTRTNNRYFPVHEMIYLFDAADRQKLLDAGDPLPEGDVFTVYRGIAGKKPYRKIRSFSWTLSFETAKLFACREDMGKLEDPAIYTAQVKRKDIYGYSNDRHEQEVLCIPKKYEKMDIVFDPKEVAKFMKMMKKKKKESDDKTREKVKAMVKAEKLEQSKNSKKKSK